MNRIYFICRFLPLNYIMRLRSRFGYGVQSPSRYSFIRHVLYQRLTYYAYSSLPPVNGNSSTSRLLFRLINFVQPKEVFIFSPFTTEKEKNHVKSLFSVFNSGCLSSNLHVKSFSDTLSIENICKPNLYKKVKCFYYIDKSFGANSLLQSLVSIAQQSPIGTLFYIEGIFLSKPHYLRWLDFIENLKNQKISFVAYEMNKRGLLLIDNNGCSKVFSI